MNLALVLKSVAASTLVAAAAALPTLAHAGAEDGVRCTPGYTPSFSNGVLRCSKTTQVAAEVRKSVCPVIPFVGTTYHQRTGGDNCTRSDNGATVATVPEFAFDPQNWRRDADASGLLDRFLKGGGTRTEFAFPLPVDPL